MHQVYLSTPGIGDFAEGEFMEHGEKSKSLYKMLSTLGFSLDTASL